MPKACLDAQAPTGFFDASTPAMAEYPREKTEPQKPEFNRSPLVCGVFIATPVLLL